MVDILFRIVDPDKTPLRAGAHLLWHTKDGASGTAEDTTDDDGELLFSLAARPDAWALVVTPLEAGYWAGYAKNPAPNSEITLSRLAKRPEPWWISNVERDASACGKGIRVGVVDQHLIPSAGIDHVRGAAPWPAGSHLEEFSHSEAVCRILGDRAFPSFAPAAELFFRAADSPNKGKLDVALVTSALGELVRDEGVHLISLSAGVSLRMAPTANGHPLAALRDVLVEVQEAGVLCFAASGNDYDQPAAVPAGFPECVGVGALGRMGWGKRGTYARQFADTATDQCTLEGMSIFHWAPSGRGQGLDLIAPGVGTVIGRDGIPAFDVTGTSFAAPAACGTLAAALSQDSTYLALPADSSRTARARELLREICQTLGMSAKVAGWGCPRW